MYQIPHTKPVSGMVISHSIRLSPGRYEFTGTSPGITIVGHHLRLNLQGVKLIGAKGSPGITLRDCNDVVLANATVQGFKTGIELDGCKNVVLRNCRALRTGDPGPGTIIDESGAQPQDTSGAGFLVRNSSEVSLQHCTAMYAWDGLDLVNSNHCSAQKSNFSYNENWGVHIWHSSFNTVSDCTAIWCTTGRGKLYQALTGWQTYDADAVLIEHGSDNNSIVNNDLRYGGDGIFIRSNEPPVTPGTAVPHVFSSDFNRLVGNDCSYSPNNAIEVDFVKGTLIERNNCSLSNYGMWLGYSRYSKVVGNLCAWDSVRAIEIENGQHGTISGNILADNGAKKGSVLVFLRQNGRDATPSGPYVLSGNLFLGGSTALALLKTPVALVNNVRSANAPQDEPPALLRSDGLSQVDVKGDTALANPKNPSAFTARVDHNGLVTVGNVPNLPKLPIAMVVWQGRPFLAVKTTEGRLLFTAQPQPTLAPWESSSPLSVYTAAGWSTPSKLSWHLEVGSNVIESVAPAEPTAGSTFEVRGRFVEPGRMMLNGVVVGTAHAPCTLITCRVPESVAKGLANLMFEPDNGLPAGPIVISVAKP